MKKLLGYFTTDKVASPAMMFFNGAIFGFTCGALLMVWAILDAVIPIYLYWMMAGFFGLTGWVVWKQQKLYKKQGG